MFKKGLNFLDNIFKVCGIKKGKKMNDEYLKLIHSEDEVRKFYALLPRLQDGGSYLISMSARNKYLTREERVEIDLGRTEMFAKKMVSKDTFESYLRVLYSYETNKKAVTSRSDVMIPSKCLVLYGNIYPSNNITAFQTFLTKSIEKLSVGDNRYFNNIVSRLNTEVQKTKGYSKFVDIDMDFNKDVNLTNKLFDMLFTKLKVRGKEGVLDNVFVIETKSGFHILLDKNYLGFNYTTIVDEMNVLVRTNCGISSEVVVNRNGMVPIPGTIQADFRVKFVDDWTYGKLNGLLKRGV
jgi:hypothetical protein